MKATVGDGVVAVVQAYCTEQIHNLEETGDEDDFTNGQLYALRGVMRPLDDDAPKPIFNARIISYEPVTVMEFDVGGEWVRYVPATEIQGWLYDRMRVFQSLGDAHAAGVLMETATQLPQAVVREER